MKVYLSGPMSGKPEYNRVAFEQAASCLRNLGHEVVSPVELDAADGFSIDDPRLPAKYWDFLGRDIRVVGTSKFDAVICLEGWWNSKGARLEVFQALLLKIPVYNFLKRLPLSPDKVMNILTESIKEEL